MDRRSGRQTECDGQSTAGDGNTRTRFSSWLLVAVLLGGLTGCRSEVERPSLLIFLTVDTLRADRLSALGGSLGLTPNLDALAEESIVFTAAYAPTSLTVPSVSAMMTGRYPSELGIWRNDSVIPDSTPTLARSPSAR